MSAITYEQSFSLPENQFEEIIRGESRIMPPTRRGHDRLLRRLEALLAAQLGPKYEVIGPGVGLGICRNPFTYRIPDKMVFSAGVDSRMDNPIYIWEAPILTVECLSPGNRKGDVNELLADYNAIGAPEVWLLDPEKRICEIHRNGSVCCEDSAVSFGQTLIPLAALWAAFERSE